MPRLKKQKEEPKVEEYTGAMGTYKVLKPFPFTDENGEPQGEFEVDSIQTLPVESVEKLIEDGFLESTVTEQNNGVATNDGGLIPSSETTPNTTYYHKGVLINTSIDEVVHHGHPFKKFSTVNKESYMLSPKEFDEQVKSIEE